MYQPATQRKRGQQSPQEVARSLTRFEYILKPVGTLNYDPCDYFLHSELILQNGT